MCTYRTRSCLRCPRGARCDSSGEGGASRGSGLPRSWGSAGATQACPGRARNSSSIASSAASRRTGKACTVRRGLHAEHNATQDVYAIRASVSVCRGKGRAAATYGSLASCSLHAARREDASLGKAWSRVGPCRSRTQFVCRSLRTGEVKGRSSVQSGCSSCSCLEPRRQRQQRPSQQRGRQCRRAREAESGTSSARTWSCFRQRGYGNTKAC